MAELREFKEGRGKMYRMKLKDYLSAPSPQPVLPVSTSSDPGGTPLPQTKGF